MVQEVKPVPDQSVNWIGKMAVVYDRASTERQRDNYSRADAARLTSLAEGHGFSQCELRQEIKSGESLSNRPIMRKILEEIEAGLIGAIICQDFTRLSRDEDGIDGRVIRQVCRDNGCIIITPDKSYDFTLDVDDDLADIGFFIGKIQKRQNLKAMARGMMEKAKQGKMLYILPSLGYTWTRINPETGRKAPDGEALIRQEDVPLAQLIFDRYEQMSGRQTALSLNREGYTWRDYKGATRPFRAADICMWVYVGVCGCYEVSVGACGYLWVSMGVCFCLWVYVRVCACMWVYVSGVCGCMLVYMGVCGCMLLSVGICRNLLVSVGVCEVSVSVCRYL